MAFSTQEVVSDGTLDELGVTIDFYDRDSILVFFEGVETPSSTGLWNWVGTSKFIAFTPAVGYGVTLTIKRQTDLSELVHQYNEGAQFRTKALDESFKQILFAAQEFEEVTVLPSDLDPLPVGSVAAAGVSNLYSRADHVHVGGTGGGGGTGTDGFSSGIVYAYQRSATVPSGTPGAVTYSFAGHTITSPAGNDLANGWKKTIPTGDLPLYVTVATASNQTPTDVIGTTEWAAPAVMAKDGVSGLNVATVYVYSRTPTEVSPPNPTTDTTYNFTTGVASGMNNGWQATVPPSFNGPYLWVNTATASSTAATDTIAGAEWAGGQILAQDGLDGANGGVDGLSNATFYAYKRAASVPGDRPGDVTYHFPSASISTPAGDALANGWTKTPPTGTNPMYVCVATASSSGTTDAVASAEWSAPQILAASGLSVATVFLYQRTASATPPASLPSADVTWTYATSVPSGMNNGWLAQVPASGGGWLWVTQATAAAPYGAATDTIPPSEWAAIKLLSQNGTNGTNGSNGSDGASGTRGTVTIAAATSGTSWSSSEANAAIAAAGYGSPINRDIVTLYNTSGGYSGTRFYDSGIWVALTAYIDGNMLVTGTLSANKVSAGTLTGQTYQTSASGQRITINESNNNKLIAYNSSGAQLLELGGTSGTIYANPQGWGLIPAIWGRQNSGFLPGVYGSNDSSGPGVQAQSVGGYGVDTFSTSGWALRARTTSGSGAFYCDGKMEQYAYPETDHKGIYCNTICGVTDNVYYCGTIALRWAGVTSATAVLVTSDSRLKTDVQPTALGLDFVNALRPVSYKLLEGHKEIGKDRRGGTTVTSIPGTRTHFGLISQEVREALVAHGAEDAAIWALDKPDDPESQQALRYEELISPLIAAVQELSARIKVLEAKE
jgi:hypothetical protein